VHIPQPVEQTKSAQRSRFAELGCQVLLVVHHSAVGLVHMLSSGATQRSVMLRVLCHSVMCRGFGCFFAARVAVGSCRDDAGREGARRESFQGCVLRMYLSAN
jgi:hypothetical protein